MNPLKSITGTIVSGVVLALILSALLDWNSDFSAALGVSKNWSGDRFMSPKGNCRHPR